MSDAERDRILLERMETIAADFRQHAYTQPIEFESSNEVVVNKWITWFSAAWKVGAVIVFMTFAWANINNSITRINESIVSIQDRCNTSHTVLYKELERELKDVRKDILHQDSIIDAKVDATKKDILVIIDSNKKDVSESIRTIKDDLDNELTSNSVTVTQLLYRFEDYKKKTETTLTNIPESITLHVKSLNDKIDKVEDSFTVKINDILMNMSSNRVTFNGLTNDFIKVSNKVDELERSVYRTKGK